jgi:hypothetical protein
MLGVGAEASKNGGYLIGGGNLARRRSTKVGDSTLGEQPNPHLPNRLWREQLRFALGALELGFGKSAPAHSWRSDRLRLPSEVPGTVDAEMDAQGQAVLELQKHLLTHGVGGNLPLAIDEHGPGGKAALRGRNGDGVTNKVPSKLARDSMDGVPLRHP